VNILLVNWQDRENPMAGGAEIHLFEIFSRVAARGHRVRLLCSGWPGGAPRAVVDGIEVERIGTRNSFTLLGRGAVRRALRAESPDIVVEDINKVPLFLPGLTSRPFVAIVPHLFGETAFKEASFPAASFVWLMERPIPLAYRRAAFHVISDSTRDDLITRGIRPGKIRVIYPGIDSAELTPDPAGVRTARPSFLYVGRLRRYKGVETAIRALAILHRSCPETGLDIAGRGDDQPRLESLARELGVSASVRFHGFVPEPVKRSLLRGAWANVFPSAKEGWGITNVEAAACGTPSLASDSPGLRDSVRHGETGFLVPHGNAEALAARMQELAADPALVARLGASARRFAESLTWDAAALATEQHLQDTLKTG
jgi:glycosyltransferase involved in cell wall biosynthesis